MSIVEHQQHPHNQLKHVQVNNWNYTEYIPVVPHYLLDCLIDWCLTPTLAVFQLYHCRMSAKCQKHLRSQLKHIGQHGVNVR